MKNKIKKCKSEKESKLSELDKSKEAVGLRKKPQIAKKILINAYTKKDKKMKPGCFT